MWPPCSFCMSNCRRRLCVPVFRINGRLNVYMIAEFPCAWLSPLSCWHHCAGWPGPRMVHHCRRFDRWPTSCLSLTNCWRISRRIITWNTCGSSYADWLSERAARPTSGKRRFLMIANMPTADMITPRCCHTATVLNDGRVLIVGAEAGAPSSLAELYTPSVLVPAPVLFSLSGDRQGQGAILHAGTARVVTASDPALPGEVLEIYGAGLNDGSAIPPQIAIGGRLAEILYFGNAP